MQIIEEISKNRINKSASGSMLQKICLDKLQLNPLPNHKSEIWRMANKSKLANDNLIPLTPKNGFSSTGRFR